MDVTLDVFFLIFGSIEMNVTLDFFFIQLLLCLIFFFLHKSNNRKVCYFLNLFLDGFPMSEL